ncbi:MAG: hypothetical protein M3Y27_18660, partial [Acidobacteriota bacterium]|nr:hypothetical protein [Acidobacteriota bacterium]
RPHADIPQLATAFDNGALYPFGINLPGSDASYAFSYRMHSGELSDSLTIAKGAHIMSLGAGVLINRSESVLTFRQDGLYFFPSIQKFAQDAPNALQVTVARAGPQGLPEVTQTPDYGRSYANNQLYGFFQDSIKLSRTVGINVGLRYESFGAVKNTGVQDGYFQLGDGTTIDQRLAGASLIYDQSHQRSLYRPDRNNWAPRFGIYYDLLGRGRTVFRGAFGAFYDRPFDNLTISTRNNNLELVNLSPPPVYPQPARVTSVGTRVTPTSVPELLWVDQNLRTPYVQSWFAGLQHQFSRDLYFEASAQGALGRKLISTDIVNRRAVNAQGNEGRLNEKIAEDIVFRSNAVASNYTALTALTRYRSRQAQFQLAYTWGHSIDNQSDPLQGTFDDLQPSRSSNVSQGDNRAAFTRQFQSGADRASSDFDQRHNVIFFFIWDVSPALRSRIGKLALERWQVSGITGYRSGFPFNLITSDLLPACPIAGGAVSSTELIRNRPSLLPGRSPFLDHRIAVPGGYQLLDPTAFCASPPGVVGNIGRNALTGPGFWNADLSIAKSFHPRVLGEAGRLQFRADFFNAFNHANLGSPEGLASVGPGSTFGQALLGRQGVQPSFPSAAPLDQLARQVQLQLKIIF